MCIRDRIKGQLTVALEKCNPDNPLEMLFDYVRIRFPTMDVQHVIRDILRLNIDFMLHEDFGFYSDTEHYYIGDIFVLTSQDEEKGVLLELKGKGCRQMERDVYKRQTHYRRGLQNRYKRVYKLYPAGRRYVTSRE